MDEQHKNKAIRLLFAEGTTSAFKTSMLTTILVCSWVSLATGLSLAILIAAAKRLPLVGKRGA